MSEQVKDDPVALFFEQLKLDRQMRDILLRLEVEISYGATASYNSSGHTHPDSKPPTGSNAAAHDIYLARYVTQKDNDGRRFVLEEARRELASWERKHTSHEGPEISVEQLVLQDGVGHSAAMVGQRYGLHENHVRRIRKRAGVRIDNGIDPDSKKLPTDERRAEVLRLREEEKLSIRQIASIVGCATSWLDKDLKTMRRGSE